MRKGIFHQQNYAAFYIGHIAVSTKMIKSFADAYCDKNLTKIEFKILFVYFR